MRKEKEHREMKKQLGCGSDDGSRTRGLFVVVLNLKERKKEKKKETQCLKKVKQKTKTV